MFLALLAISFQELLSHVADGCGAPGYLNNFTYHPLELISGYNLRVYSNVVGDKETLRATCEGYCLSNSQCISYEIDFSRNTCYISNYDMYDIPLSSSSIYDYYNRVYNCGCPPSQGENVLNSYSSTTDGSILDISCTNGGRNYALPISLNCTSDGWGVTRNAYSCTVACGDPANIVNGTHNGTLSSYSIGDLVSYTCDTGYVNMVTKQTISTIQCQSDGTWEEVPTCIIDCGSPGTIQNAVVTGGSVFTPGENVQYTCNAGFVMTDTKFSSQSITCKDIGIWQNAPSCVANCGAAPTISNAFVSQGDTFIPGDNATYTCNANYVITGTKTNSYSISCQDDGNWSSLQNCTKYCGSPPVVSNSQNTATDTLYIEGEEIVYSCNQGFVMIDSLLQNATLTCLNTGLWESAPFCTVYCGRPGRVANSAVTDGEIFFPGHNVTYTCSSGYVIIDTKAQSESITCLDDGSWEKKPSCTVHCGTAPSVSNAAVTSGNLFIPGESVIYTCNPSYVVEGTKDSSATVLCQNNGNWAASPTCTRYCGSPPVVSNSQNSATETFYVQNEEVVYKCDIGYVMIDTLESNATLTCLNTGLWDAAPFCTVYCGRPGKVANSAVTDGDIFLPGHTVTYTCSSGYVITDTKTQSESITCQGDGSWEKKPSCTVYCGTAPSVSNAVVTSGSLFIPGESVIYTCNPSFVVVSTKQSSKTVACQNNGTWASSPTCTKDCGSPPSIPHSTNDASSDVYIPSEQVIYSCVNGYIMSGSLQPQAAITCQNNGIWSETPICIVNCGAPPTVQYATKSNQGSIFTPGDYVTWTCNSRYVVRATNIRSADVICKGDGTWTTKPICIAYCGEHPEVDHTQVQGTGSQQGDTRTYTCDVGHTMVGSATITCQSNSQWEDAPICPADCGDPPTLSKGSLIGSGNLENNTRNATCGDGYVLEGSSTIKCQMDGEWETLPHCTAKEVFQFKQSMFGAEKSPVSQETGIAMTIAIILGILLIGIGVVYCYNLCKQKRKTREDNENESGKQKSLNNNGSIYNINGNMEKPTQENTYQPFGHAFKGDRSWRDLFY